MSLNEKPKCPKCNGMTKLSHVEYKYVCKLCNHIVTKKEEEKWKKSL